MESPPDVEAAGTGWIRGRFFTRYGPCREAEVGLYGTGHSTVTDSLGRFLLGDVPAGTCSLYSQTYRFLRRVDVVAGDTTIANMAYDYPTEETVEWWDPIRVEFRLDVPPGLGCDGLMLFADGSLRPADRTGPCSYSVRMPPDFCEISWSLPWLGERTRRLRDCKAVREGPVVLRADTALAPAWLDSSPFLAPLDEEEYPLAIADREPDEWVSPEWAVETIVLDAREWTQWLPFRALRFLFEDGGEERWRAVAVHPDGYVVAGEEGTVRREDLDVGVPAAWLSPRGERALLRVRPVLEEGAAYAILDTGSGRMRPFDPFPELTVSEEGLYEGPGGNTVITRPARRFRVYDSGRVLGRYDHELRGYDASGRQTLQFVPNERSAPYEATVRCDMADGVERWALLLTSRDMGPLLFGGDTEHAYSYPSVRGGIVSTSRPVLSRDATRIACLNGRHALVTASMDEWDTGIFPYAGSMCEDPVFSPDGALLAGVVEESHGPTMEPCCFVCSTAAPQRIVTSFPAFTVHWSGARPLELTDDGLLMVRMGKRGNGISGRRYAILDADGEPVWMSHYTAGHPGRAARPVPRFAVSSPSGSRFAYSDGRFIRVLTLERKEP
ncbi:MAG: carboxypeptidase-like regulatory domain-containing protein [Candidatus Fermentibacterota bacterium]